MEVVLLLLALVILMVIGLLLIPLQLYINTSSKIYSARVGHLAKAYVEADTVEIIRIRMRVLGYQFFVYPLKKKKSARKKLKKKRKPKAPYKNLKKGGQWVIRFLRSFKIKEFQLNVDTGDFVRNAQLYPIFGFINHYYLPCSINFQGVNTFVLDLRSRPWNIIKSFIHF